MSDTNEHLRRGEAPKLLSRLHGALERDFSYRYSRTETRDGMHAAMTVAAIRQRYGLPDALPDAKIEAVMCKVTRGRAQARPGHVILVRMRDRKAVHVEEIRRAPAGMMAQNKANFEASFAASVSALQAMLLKRGRRAVAAPVGTEPPDYAIFALEGFDTAASDTGPAVTRRGRRLAALHPSLDEPLRGPPDSGPSFFAICFECCRERLDAPPRTPRFGRDSMAKAARQQERKMSTRTRKADVPKSLLECMPEPAAMEVWESQRDVGLYLEQLALASSDCRTRLAKVKKLLAAQ